MTASRASPESRNACSAPGTAASAKANRSRTVTGDEWWLKPMTTRGMLKPVRGRKQVDAPEGQDYERKTGHRPPSEFPPGLGEAPVQDEQHEIQPPHQAGPNHFGIGGRVDIRPVLEQGRNKRQAGRQEQEPR